MADIEWPLNENPEVMMAMLKDKVNEHHLLLHGNGQPGILDFISGLKGQMRLMMAMLIFISVIAAVVAALATVALARHAQIEIPSITHSDFGPRIYAEDQFQDAIIPRLAR